MSQVATPSQTALLELDLLELEGRTHTLARRFETVRTAQAQMTARELRSVADRLSVLHKRFKETV